MYGSFCQNDSHKLSLAWLEYQGKTSKIIITQHHPYRYIHIQFFTV